MGTNSAILIPLHEARRERLDIPVSFDRRELDQILRLYGRMVAANEWRDYAIDHLRDRAVFSVYRRAHDAPLFQIVKDPRLARKQGMFSVVAATGAVMKRGHELTRVLGFFDRKTASSSAHKFVSVHRISALAGKPLRLRRGTAAPAGRPGRAAWPRRH